MIDIAFYKNPEEMFRARAEKYQKAGDAHYAQAKNGEDGNHYEAAKRNYRNAEAERSKSEKAEGKSW